MARIHITSKRQTTLPVALCDQMGVGPGDDLIAEERELEGERVWVLRPVTRRWDWLGAAKPWAEGKSHEVAALRAAAAAGWSEGESE